MDLISNFTVINDMKNSLTSFYIFDEVNFMKEFILDSSKAHQLDFAAEYYVGPEFYSKKSEYSITNDMLYDKLSGYLLQPKEKKTEDMAIKWSIDQFNLEESKLSDKFPLVSYNWL